MVCVTENELLVATAGAISKNITKTGRHTCMEVREKVNGSINARRKPVDADGSSRKKALERACLFGLC